MWTRAGLAAAAITTALLVTACGDQGPGSDEPVDTSTVPEIGPGATEGLAPGSISTHDGSGEVTSAPEGRADGPLTELRGSADSDPQMFGSMTQEYGDGSAEPILLSALELPERWRLVDPDGPHFVQTVCGVQLDPVMPRDAAQRRWGLVEDFIYLDSEVHLFTEEEAHGLVGQVGEALEACEGYGVTEGGDEAEYGEGDYNVSIERWQPEESGMQDWLFFTETTEETGMVRHVAMRDLPDGWHWVSLVSYYGSSVERMQLTDAVAQSGA